MVPWVGLQCVIEVFPGHTRLLFVSMTSLKVFYLSNLKAFAFYI